MLRTTQSIIKATSSRATITRRACAPVAITAAPRVAGLSSVSNGLGRSKLPVIKNEPTLNYAPGSVERARLIAAVQKMKSEVRDIPCIIGGKEIRTGRIAKHVMPSAHQHVLANVHEMDGPVATSAVEASLAAKSQWEATSFESRAAIFLKAADLMAGKYRPELCAAMMLGMSKNPWQAEIDCAEMIDFWRFNAKYAEELYATQPSEHSPGIWNRTQYRPLEGFVVAISPFNFAAIGANLPSTPALLGNTVIWKPSHTAVLANYITYRVLQEAGLPDGVINFIPGEGTLLGSTAFSHPMFAGLHFTGSTNTFNTLWKQISNNLDKYRTYPRLVGETGGKNFHLVHPSADVENVVNQTLRSAFEYQGQKCSALSRAYIPSNLWPTIKRRLLEEVQQLKVGQPDDFKSFVCSVIDEKSFDRITNTLNNAKRDPAVTVLAGGNTDKSAGFFVEPTILQTKDPLSDTMVREIFGPVLTIYVYDADKFDETLQLVDQTSPYALTGSIFASDRYALDKAVDGLKNAAGNFYINDKCTGAVVGQQAFGGARGSGTNDKSGSGANLMRWVSIRSIKESSLPIGHWSYPHMA